MDRLGLEGLVDESVSLVGRVGGANPGRKTLTLVAGMLLGATHIDHVDQLRSGSTESVLNRPGFVGECFGPARIHGWGA